MLLVLSVISHVREGKMLLSRNIRADLEENVGTANDHKELFAKSKYKKELIAEEVENGLRFDISDIPPLKARAGYHGADHFEYWLSGVRDYQRLMHFWSTYQGLQPPGTFLDLGGSSGRVARHMAARHPEMKVILPDIEVLAIEWALKYLPENVMAFQNLIVPPLPIADGSVDYLSSFSVFTHMDNYEYSWLAECRRIINPDGLLYITAMTERCWDAFMNLDWRYRTLLNSVEGFEKYPRGCPMPGDRVALLDKSGSYGTTFHSTKHINDVWGRFFEILEIYYPPGVETIGEQAIVVMRPR